jgi:hypothetical protein
MIRMTGFQGVSRMVRVSKNQRHRLLSSTAHLWHAIRGRFAARGATARNPTLSDGLKGMRGCDRLSCVETIPLTEGQFYSGPYDGLILDAESMRRSCFIFEARKGGQNRYVVLMPPPAAWEAVISGWTDHETVFKSLHIYELVTTGEMGELRYRSSGTFRKIMRRA